MKYIETFESFSTEDEKNIDNILDKINDYGYNSLTDEELFILKNQGEII